MPVLDVIGWILQTIMVIGAVYGSYHVFVGLNAFGELKLPEPQPAGDWAPWCKRQVQRRSGPRGPRAGVSWIGLRKHREGAV